jgi:hypothetical protein
LASRPAALLMRSISHPCDVGGPRSARKIPTTTTTVGLKAFGDLKLLLSAAGGGKVFHQNTCAWRKVQAEEVNCVLPEECIHIAKAVLSTFLICGNYLPGQPMTCCKLLSVVCVESHHTFKVLIDFMVGIFHIISCNKYVLPQDEKSNKLRHFFNCGHVT